MKTPNSIFPVFLLSMLLMTVSCREEEMILNQAPTEEILAPNSQAADLMQRTAMNDGSTDNIIDNSNCFTVQLPVTVIANNTEITLGLDTDYDLVEDIFDEYDDDDDTIEIVFPITIILNDFTEIEVNSMTDLAIYSDDCNDENAIDDDIECVNFQYPITVSIFNTNNELISTNTITDDEMMYNFIDDIDDYDIVALGFPISIEVPDGTMLTVNDVDELEEAIETYGDDCDEDDDNDYNDDDCNDCTPLELTDILTNCSDWTVDKLERNGNNYDDNYAGYIFNFFTDETVSVTWGSTTVYGTWTASGTANNITVDINIPSLPYCNLDWNLHEIEQESGETEIDLRVGDNDRMQYESNCD